MGRIIGILLVVAAVWLAANYVTQRKVRGEDPDAPARSIPQHVGSRVQDAQDEAMARREALLPE